jgi:spore coat protein U-like protein
MKKILSVLSLVAFSLVSSGSGHAGSVTGSLPVSAAVAAVCTVSTSAVSFGSVTGLVVVTTTGDVTVNCTVSLPYHIALDGGQHLLGNPMSGFTRNIISGSYGAPYVLIKPTGGLSWGDSDYSNTFPSGSSLADTGSGANQAHTVNATLPPFASVPGGTNLTDTVTVTVYY